MASFNLVDEPFVPCRFLGGNTADLSLLDALTQAHVVAEINDQSPLVECGLHLLLLAIVHRVFGPKDPGHWKSMWDAGSFAESSVRDYLQKWRARLDLFDEDRPFYQYPAFTTSTPKPLSKLALEMASGRNPVLFDHTSDTHPPSFSFAESARLLIAYQYWALGGGNSATGYRQHAPGVGGLTAFSIGDSLFQTLMLNLPQYGCELFHSSVHPPENTYSDQPVWEREELRPPGEQYQPNGLLDYLTWQSRAVRLTPEDSRVRHLHLAQGAGLQDEVLHPYSCYRQTSDGVTRLSLSESRALWRDSTALLSVRSQDVTPPVSVRWLGRLADDHLLSQDRVISLRIYGVNSYRAKIKLWRRESLPFPVSYLTQPQLVTVLSEAVSYAEVGYEALWEAVRTLCRYSMYPDHEARPDWNEVNHLVDSLQADSAYWPKLEYPFRHFMVHVARPGADAEQLAMQWLDKLVGAARDAYELVADKMAPTGRNLRAVSLGRGVFEHKLRQELPMPFGQEVDYG